MTLKGNGVTSSQKVALPTRFTLFVKESFSDKRPIMQRGHKKVTLILILVFWFPNCLYFYLLPVNIPVKTKRPVAWSLMLNQKLLIDTWAGLLLPGPICLLFILGFISVNTNSQKAKDLRVKISRRDDDSLWTEWLLWTLSVNFKHQITWAISIIILKSWFICCAYELFDKHEYEMKSTQTLHKCTGRAWAISKSVSGDSWSWHHLSWTITRLRPTLCHLPITSGSCCAHGKQVS